MTAQLQPDLPSPGMDGTFRDSCVVCLRGTDTAIGFGPAEAEWALAGLQLLGVPEDQAEAIVSAFTGCDPGTVSSEDVTISVRVCRSCMAASDLADSGMTLGVVPAVPVYGPPR